MHPGELLRSKQRSSQEWKSLARTTQWIVDTKDSQIQRLRLHWPNPRCIGQGGKAVYNRDVHLIDSRVAGAVAGSALA
jgi:hypothetical protein